MTETVSQERNNRKLRQGKVISVSGNKSVVVQGETRVRHPLYGKVLRKFKKYHVHDEQNVAKVDDTVTIMETRPISKLKHWRLISVNNADVVAK